MKWYPHAPTHPHTTTPPHPPTPPPPHALTPPRPHTPTPLVHITVPTYPLSRIQHIQILT